MKNLCNSPTKTKPLRIFVVEDHPTSANYLRRFLEARGHTVGCADTMRQALDELPQTKYDVLLCDIHLPDGCGWDLLPLVDQDFPRPTMAVAMSADVRTETHVESGEAGFFHHLDKPIDPQALEAVLDQATWIIDGLTPEENTSPDKCH